MHTPRCWIMALLAGLVCASAAPAHFLFIRILPPQQESGKRFAEVYFSDQADAGDPTFIDKIAHTRLWQQSKPGKFDPLTVERAADRLRTPVAPSGGVSVIGECTYGVLARTKQPSFLLRHYPKAIVGSPDDIHALQLKSEIPFEIQVRVQGDSLTFTALRNGKPIPGAVFWSVATDLKGGKFTANAEGQASWKPPARDYYAVYTSQFLKEAGSYQGKKYEEIREFATVAFPWPLTGKTPDKR